MSADRLALALGASCLESAARVDSLMAQLEARHSDAEQRHRQVLAAFDRLDAAFDAIQIRSTASNPHLSGSERDPMSED